jgi:hypothetical protein
VTPPIEFMPKKATDAPTAPEPETLKTVRLVIARYREKMDWLVAIPEDYQIYISNSGDRNTLDIPLSVASRVEVVDTPNVGREAGHWLRYVVARYDDLADINVFLQGSPYQGHTPDILFKMERPDLEAKPFKYLCAPPAPTRFLGDGTGFAPRALIAIAVARKYPIVPLASGGVWGAQHQAAREVIHNYPKEWYEMILAKAATDKFANIMEHAYNVVYGVPPEILPAAPKPPAPKPS